MVDGQRGHPWLLLQVNEERRSNRLDTWLSEQIEGLSRRKAKELIETGEVTLNGSRTKKSNVLKLGDEVAVWTEPILKYWGPAPDPTIHINLLYEDEHILAVEKPSGIPSTPLTPAETGTLAGAIVARYPECALIGKSYGDGGLIQRLDRETSGIVLAAKSERAYDLLSEMQRRNGIEKKYLALVHQGEPELPEIIDVPLAPSDRGGRKTKPTESGKPATTRTKSMGVHDQKLLIKATIFKGFRHQIRAHLAHVGFPIIGDQIYDIDPLPSDGPRLMLHASKLILNHPVTGEPLSISSPLPKDFGIEETDV